MAFSWTLMLSHSQLARSDLEFFSCLINWNRQGCTGAAAQRKTHKNCECGVVFESVCRAGNHVHTYKQAVHSV